MTVSNELSHFKPIIFGESKPYISLTSAGLTFNKETVQIIGKPAYVVLLIDEPGKRLAIQSASKNDEYSISFLKSKTSKVLSVRLNSKELMNTLTKLMNWNLKINSYKIYGKVIANPQAIIFDLKKAVPLR